MAYSDAADLMLLRSVEKERDRQAFNELFARHQDRCYSLAYHILQNSALAEECVQDAMLALWLAPKMERADQNVQALILSLVAGKSMNMRRGRKRQSRREARCSPVELENPPSAEVEHGETLETVRRHLQDLPELDSQLLACCYGAELSHQRISEIFGIPRRTITGRIQQALTLLRSRLGVETEAAMVPLASLNLLRQVVTTGHTCPPMQLSFPAKASPRSRHIRRLPKRTSYAGIVAGCAALTVAVVAAFAMNNQPAAAQKTVAPQPMPSPLALPERPADVKLVAAPLEPKPAPPSSPIHVTAPALLPVHRRWDFAQKPENLDIVDVNHNWTWSPADGGEMTTNDRNLPVIVLPDALHGQNFRLKILFDATVKCDVFILWIDDNKTVPFEYREVTTSLPMKASDLHSTELVYRAGEAVQWYDGHVNTHRQYATTHPGDHILLQFNKLTVKSISIDTISDEEAAAAFKGAAQGLRELQARPLEHYIQQTLPDWIRLK